MDVLTVRYCDLVTLPVFWLVFVALFVTNVMYCNIFEKSLYSNSENLYWNFSLNGYYVKSAQPFNHQDLISISPYCLSIDYHHVSLENLVSDQLIIP